MPTEVKTTPGQPTEASAASADQRLIDLLSGMWKMQAVATAARLSLPDLLAAGPLTAEELARQAGAHPGAMRRLVRLLSGIGVLAPADGGRYRLTEVSQLLREDTPGTLKHMFIAETDGVHWHSWEKAADAVRTGLPRPQAVFGMPAFDYYGQHRDEGEQFGRAMANVSGFASEALLAAYDFSGIQTLCDVGGGNGSLARAILARYPKMRALVADLSYIEAQANEHIRAAGVADRCRFEAADFFERVPSGADAHILKFILHDWNDDESVRLLQKSRAAIAPGGRLLVVEVIVPEENRPDFSHLMDMNMLVITGGLERTEKEYAALLARAGYRLSRLVPTASPFSLIEAQPA